MKKRRKETEAELREVARKLLTERFLEFTEEYERLNPNWIQRLAAQHVYESLANLQRYLEDDSDAFVTWETPRTRLIYPVELDWEKWPTPSLITHRTSLEEVTKSNIGKVFSENFYHYQRTSALFALTNGVLLVRTEEDDRKAEELEREEWGLTEEEIASFERMEIDLTPEDEAEIRKILVDAEREDQARLFGGRYLLPLPVQERLSGLTEEEAHQALEDIAYYTVEIPLGTSEGSNDSFFLSTSPLIAIPHKKEAYFQTVVDLNLTSFIEKYAPTEDDLRHLLKELLMRFKKAIPEDVLPTRLFTTPEDGDARLTMAIPSTPQFRAILGLFAGNPGFIPTKALAKKHEDRTEEERRIAAGFTRSRVHPPRLTIDPSGREIPATTRRIVTVSDGPLVKARGEVPPDLFEGDPDYEQEKLARLVAKTYGPQGLRHFLGIVVALERNGRKGWIDWDVDEHLDALGFGREKSGSHKTADKESAYEIALLMTNLTITEVESDKSGAKELRQMKLFTVTGRSMKKAKNVVVKERLRIEATSFWYEDALRDLPGRGRQYTKLLQSIAKEDHRTHGFAIQLGGQLAIDWRVSGEPNYEMKVYTVSRRLGITKTRKYRETLRKLEAELDYMVEREHLGSWKTKSGNIPSESSIPEDEVFVFTAPEWFRTDIARIQEGREEHRLTSGERKRMTSEEFTALLRRSGLTAKEFAVELGVSPALVSRIQNGKRSVSPEVEALVLEKFAHILEHEPPGGADVEPNES